MKIPEWAENYFKIEDGLLKFEVSDEHDYFMDIKKDLKERVNDSSVGKESTREEFELMCVEYALCNIALGIIKYNKATLAKKNINTPKRKSINDGRGQQHWLPECYTKHFAKDSKVFRINEGALEELFNDETYNEDIVDDRSYGRLVPINSNEFKESNKEKGKFYAPWFELVLSSFEDDYGVIANKNKFPADGWSYMVVYFFFLILANRTKERKDLDHPGWHKKESLLFSAIPSIIANSNFSLIHKSCIFPQELYSPEIGLPFTQHPVISEVTQEGNVRLWAIYKRDILIWFSHKDDNIQGTQNLFLEKVKSIVGDGDKKVYFHPEDYPWRIHLEYIPNENIAE